MRMFWYYVLHTFKNQVRKLFKTWVVIVIAACMLLGGLIGLGAGALFDKDEGTSASEAAPEKTPRSFGEKMTVFELAADGVVLGMLVLSCFSADKSGSAIFLPADVSLLFPSPRKPQTILMFRVVLKLGGLVFASVYMLFQLPNLILNLGIPVWGALAVILAWGFTLMYGQLLNVLIYTVATTHLRLKRLLRPAIFTALGLLAAAFYVFFRRSGLALYPAAAAFFNSTASRWVPVFGWIKGFCMYAVEGNTAAALAGILLLVLTGGLLIWLIWHIRADFYEDAMAKSEETARLQAQAQESGHVVAVRKKERGDKLRRDGLRRGRGADVFFWKSMYNRFRFGHLGYFTKTAETYLAAGAGTALLVRYLSGGGPLTIPALTVAGLAFFRSLGSPLSQDIESPYFRLIPEPMGKKLFYSMLGGSLNCLLDAVPGLLAAALILGASPLQALGWCCFIVSVDFYSTNVGTFIAVSTPASAGLALKQVVQILFVYFGLLPDAAILAAGFSARLPQFPPEAALAVSAAFNVAVGFLFLALIPLFLIPRSRPVRPAARLLDRAERARARRSFSRAAFAFVVILAAGTALQAGLMVAVRQFRPDFLQSDWALWILTFAPLYLVAVPLGLLVLRRMPRTAGETARPRLSQVPAAVFIALFLLMAGSLAGQLAQLPFRLGTGAAPENPLDAYAVGQGILPRLLFFVLLAPVIEEFLFRRCLIDRLRRYGEKNAVFVSAAMFGLFHGNLSQMFYAFSIGLLLGYVYLRTGKLRFSVLLHMFINLLGGIAAPALLERAGDLENLSNLADAGPLAAYVVFMLVSAAVGLVLLCLRARTLRFDPAPEELPKRQRAAVVWWNPGMVVFVLTCLGMVAATFFTG